MQYNFLSGTVHGKWRSRLFAAAIFVFFALSVFVIYAINLVTVSLQPSIFNGSLVDVMNSKTSANNVQNKEHKIRKKPDDDPTPQKFVFLQEIILDAQRMKIAKAMHDFEFTDGMEGLSDLTPETYGNPIRSGEIHVKMKGEKRALRIMFVLTF